MKRLLQSLIFALSLLLAQVNPSFAVQYFWVGGTANMNDANTANLALTSGGAGGNGPITSADSLVFDANSGGGVVTFTSDLSIQSLTCGAFTGTLTWVTNNNNLTLSSTTGFNCSGTGTRTISLGNGVYTLTACGASNLWNFGTVTNLTFNANGSTIRYTGNCGSLRAFVGGGLTYNNVDIQTSPLMGGVSLTGSNTIATFTVAAPNTITFQNLATSTFTNAPNLAGSTGSFINLVGQGAHTVTVTSGTFNCNWCTLRAMGGAGGGSFNATNTIDEGGNTNWTITAPSFGGGGGTAHIIGGN